MPIPTPSPPPPNPTSILHKPIPRIADDTHALPPLPPAATRSKTVGSTPSTSTPTEKPPNLIANAFWESFNRPTQPSPSSSATPSSRMLPNTHTQQLRRNSNSNSSNGISSSVPSTSPKQSFSNSSRALKNNRTFSGGTLDTMRDNVVSSLTRENRSLNNLEGAGYSGGAIVASSSGVEAVLLGDEGGGDGNDYEDDDDDVDDDGMTPRIKLNSSTKRLSDSMTELEDIKQIRDNLRKDKKHEKKLERNFKRDRNVGTRRASTPPQNQENHYLASPGGADGSEHPVLPMSPLKNKRYFIEMDELEYQTMESINLEMDEDERILGTGTHTPRIQTDPKEIQKEMNYYIEDGSVRHGDLARSTTPLGRLSPELPQSSKNNNDAILPIHLPSHPDTPLYPTWLESARWLSGLEQSVMLDSTTGLERFGPPRPSGSTMHGFIKLHSCLERDCVFLFGLEVPPLPSASDNRRMMRKNSHGKNLNEAVKRETIDLIVDAVIEALKNEGHMTKAAGSTIQMFPLHENGGGVNKEGGSSIENPKVVTYTEKEVEIGIRQAFKAHHHHADSLSRHEELERREERRRKERRIRRMKSVGGGTSLSGKGVSWIESLAAKIISHRNTNDDFYDKKGNGGNGSHHASDRDIKPHMHISDLIPSILHTNKPTPKPSPLQRESSKNSRKTSSSASPKQSSFKEKEDLQTDVSKTLKSVNERLSVSGVDATSGLGLEFERTPPDPPLPSVSDYTDYEDYDSSSDSSSSSSDSEADLEIDDESFSIMVGACPFLTQPVAAFVSLSLPTIVSDISEEGYRTRDLFLCLGPTKDSEDIWQIGRSFAVLMSQQQFAGRVDRANCKEDIIEIVSSFIDQSVIIPAAITTQTSEGTNNGSVKDDDKSSLGGSHHGSDFEQDDLDLSHHSTKSNGSSKNLDHHNYEDDANHSNRSLVTSFRLVAQNSIRLKIEKVKWFKKALIMMGVMEKPKNVQLQISLPEHINFRQRRLQIAKERMKQFSSQSDFQDDVEAKKCEVVEWKAEDKRSLIVIITLCVGVIIFLLAWIGPQIEKEKDRSTSLHIVHMHTYAGEVSGLGAVRQGHPVMHFLDEVFGVEVFDIKIVAQVVHTTETFASAARKLAIGVGVDASVNPNDERNLSPPSTPALSIAEAYARQTRSLAAADVDVDLDKLYIDMMLYHSHPTTGHIDAVPCLSNAYKITLDDHEEAELLIEVVTSNDVLKICSRELSDSSASEFYWEVTTNSVEPVAYLFQVDGLPLIAVYRTVLSALLLCVVYLCIVTDVIHRTLVAMVGAAMSITLLATMSYHTSMETALIWMDEGTLALLFGMMCIVNLLSTTGLFEWVAIRALAYSKGDMAQLLVLLCVATAFLSAFLDNVTTMLLLAPVTIDLCKIVQINPVPFLISEVMFSNIGGTSTMIGDPPNIIIGNMLSEYVSFVDFIVNLMPCIFFCSFPAMIFLRYWYKDEFDETPKKFDIELLKMKYKINDPILLSKSLAILSTVLFLFFLHPLHHVDTSWIAVLGAIALMVIATPHELHHVFECIEWDTLLFFAALFVMIEAMATMGLIRAIGSGLSSVIAAADEDSRLTVAVIMILWVSAIVSGFLDNIPYTATMVPVIKLLSEDPALNLPLRPLVWALSLGACLGGNMTLVGASANLVTAGTAEAHGHVLGFREFMKIGTCITFITVSVATAYCYVVYVVMEVGKD